MRESFSVISSQIRSRKKILFGGLVIALLFSLVPLHIAEAANIFSDIFNAIKNLPISIPVLIIAIPLFVLAGVMGAITTVLSTLMLGFVKATMAIGVTPANQEIVEIGWDISLGLVNIVFILVLVFIGLATILRLQTYQLQKTLPSLIIIALLVNFSGVLVGFVVDIGNIFTIAFLSKATSFAGLGQGLLGVGEQILEMITAPGLTVFTEAISLILQIVVQFIYFVFAALIMFIIMLLFFVRTVILWILAILAPIAFACYILPATKRFWSQWLQQLIQWSIIGIPISLFLLISSQVLPEMNNVLEKEGPDGTSMSEALKNAFIAYPSLSDVIVSIVGNFMVLALLFVGVTLSMQLAPAGASKIVGWGATAGIMAGLGLASAASRQLPMGKFGENIRKRAQGIEVKEGEKTRLERWGGAVLGKIPGAKGLGKMITDRPTLERKLKEMRAGIDELGTQKQESGAEVQRLQSRKNELDAKFKAGRASPEEIAELNTVNADLASAQTKNKDIDKQIADKEAERTKKEAELNKLPKENRIAGIARRGVRMFGSGVEMAGKELDMRTGAKDEREVAAGTKDVGNKDSFQVFNMVNEELTKGPLANWNRIVGMLNGVRNRNDGDDIEDAVKSGQLSKAVIGRAIRQGKRVGPPGFRPLLKSFSTDIFMHPEEYGFEAQADFNLRPDGSLEKFRGFKAKRDPMGNVMQDASGDVVYAGKDAKWLASQFGNIWSKFSAQDYQGDALAPLLFKMNTPEAQLFAQMITKERGADFFGQIVRRPRKIEGQEFLKYIFKEGRFAQSGLGEDWLLENAPDVLRYITSTAARSAGVGVDIAPNEANDKIQIARSLQRITDERVRGEVSGIVKAMQNIENQRDIADVLGTDPQLRSMFTGMNQDDRIRVAGALARIRGAETREGVAVLMRDLGKEKGPRLSNVADTLAAIPDPATRNRAADILASIPDDNTRAGVANVLRREPALIATAGQGQFLQQMLTLLNGIEEAQRKLTEAQQQRVPQDEINDITADLQAIRDRYNVAKESKIKTDPALETALKQVEGASGGAQQQGQQQTGRRGRRGRGRRRNP